MTQKYTRLKWSLLLRVLAGTLAALLLGALALHFLVDGLFQDPFARCFVWISQTLFGQSRETALELYQTYVRDLKHLYIGAAVVIIMLLAFWQAMGMFTRWLNRISAAVRQVADETGEPLSLPRPLAPLQRDLTALQVTLRQREQLAREPYPLPTMRINPSVRDIDGFRYEDFELVGYQAWPHIKGVVAV